MHSMGMTEQEAINEFKERLAIPDYKKSIPKYYEAMEMAVKALEKQIPKNPNIEGDGYADGHLVYDTWICPNCEKDYEIDYDDYDYCPNCGQCINKPVFDWENNDLGE